MKLKMVTKTFLIAIAMVIGMLGAARAQVQQNLAAESVIETIKKRGTLRVGLSTFVPWAMVNKKGELVGFEVDVASKVAKDMEVEVEFVPTVWSGIIPALIAGKFDVIISSMSIRPSRNLTVNFTIPYGNGGQQMAASTELAAGFSMEDFNNPDVTLACRRGATSCMAGESLFPKATLRRFDDDASIIQEVLNGNAHAAISEGPKPTFWTLRNPDKLYKPFAENLTESNEAFAVRKGDPDAINFFDNWIRANTSNGWIKERNDYWFETQLWADDVEFNQ